MSNKSKSGAIVKFLGNLLGVVVSAAAVIIAVVVTYDVVSFGGLPATKIRRELYDLRMQQQDAALRLSSYFSVDGKKAGEEGRYEDAALLYERAAFAAVFAGDRRRTAIYADLSAFFRKKASERRLSTEEQ